MRYHKQWRLDRARGIPRTVDATRTRQHIEHLLAQGVTGRAIGEAAGLSPTLVGRLTSHQQRTVKASTQRAVLAVTLDRIVTRQRQQGHVPAIGSRRRIQALMANGWRHADITAALAAAGVRTHSQLVLLQAGDLLQRKTADAVATVYDQLWDKRGPSQWTASRALAAGYAPPLAWDDDSIDDPNARPSGADQLERARRTRASADLVDEVEFLAECGETVAGVSARLRMRPDTLQRSLFRAQRHDLWARLQHGTPNHDERTA